MCFNNKKKFLNLFLVLITISYSAYSQLPDRSKFTDSASYHEELFKSPLWDKPVHCFIPKSPGTFPLVIICRSFGIDANEYEELIVHLVNKNCFVLYAPSRRISFTRNKIIDYDFGVDGIIEAVKRFPQIDTTRVGVIGHGFGAGAVPSLMRKLRANSWGNDGAFMYLMSPWYLYSIDERDMVSFPQDVSMVVQIFQDDRYNDPRIAADIFNISGIPSSNKSFIIVPTDTIGPVRYKADYVTPLGNNSEFGQFDALDSLAIFRIADSLIAGSFYDDTISCKLLDGEGAFRELHMRSRFVGDSIPPLITTDSPFVHISNRMGVYLNQWNSTRNPRIDANTFRKSRKIYLQHKSKKIKQVSKYIVKTAIASNDDVESEIVNPIDSGFGSDGTFTLRAESFPSPLLQDNVVSVYLPDSIDKPVPLILFMHGYNGGDPDYFSHTIKHIISRGMAVIFSPYPSFPSPAADKPETVLDKYKIAFTGIEEAVHRYSQFLDTNRIGIVGHSFGAGAVPSIAYRCMVEKSWGKQAVFLFVTAPWYMYGITDSQLTMLPAHLKMVTIVFDDDNINDHQMAVDLFNRIHINASEKDYIVFYSDTSDSFSVTANHFTPYSVQNINGVQDNFDYFGIFKLFDALAAYSFSGDLEGKKVALGNGSTEQCYMGEWPDGSPVRKLSVSDKPKALKTQLSYLFAWDNPLNPWRLKKPSLRSRLK